MVVSGKSGCIRAKVVVFGSKRLYSGKIGCTRAKMVVLVKSGCIRTKVFLILYRLLYLGKVVVFGQTWLFSNKLD